MLGSAACVWVIEWAVGQWTCRHGAGRSVGSGEECVPTERTPHPLRAGGGHRVPAGLLPALQAPLHTGQFPQTTVTPPHPTQGRSSPSLSAFCNSLSVQQPGRADPFNPGMVQEVRTCVRPSDGRETSRWLLSVCITKKKAPKSKFINLVVYLGCQW